MKVVYRIAEQDYVGARDLFLANEKPWYRRISRRLMPWLGGLLLAKREMAPIASLIYVFSVLRLRDSQIFSALLSKRSPLQHDFITDISGDCILIATPTAESRMKEVDRFPGLILRKTPIAN